jgi:calcium/calmodulin-dependent protein kinase I
MGGCVSSILAMVGGGGGGAGGGGASGAAGRILEVTDGGEVDYHERFMEDHVIGEGEFGQVKLVIDVREELDHPKNNDNDKATATTMMMMAAASSPIPKACKILRKGMTFKDNTIYSPIKPEILRGEVEMLRALSGQAYCLALVAVYESRRTIYIVTEFCGGGAMMEYVAAQKDDLRTEDVSRIAFQLFSAIDHCANHGIMHRDIKPENSYVVPVCTCIVVDGGVSFACRHERPSHHRVCVCVCACVLARTVMFADPAPHSPMRLIDFGSGSMDSSVARNPHMSDDDLPVHTTFAGSAFYISPELFQRTYNLKTDVWSAGVALYVLVAGYPADELQKAFNVLQTGKNRNLRKLPNLPEDLPDSYYEMLEAALTYRHKRRPRAGKVLECDFVQFHKQLAAQDSAGAVPLSLDEVASAAASASEPAVSFAGSVKGGSAPSPSVGGGGRGTTSMRLKGSVRKHSIFLDFKNFERSLTAVLATMLSKRELDELVKILTERVTLQDPSNNGALAPPPPPPPEGSLATPTEESDCTQAPAAPAPPMLSQESSMTLDGATGPPSNEQRLGVILISELKSIIRDELRSAATIETIEKLPNEKLYASFAYHVTLLHEFLFVTGGGARSSAGRRRIKRTNSLSHGLKPGVRTMTGSNQSVRSASGGSLRGGTTMMTNFRSSAGANGSIPAAPGSATKTIPNSVHGSSVFASLRARNKTQSVPDFALAAAAGNGGAGSGGLA